MSGITESLSAVADIPDLSAATILESIPDAVVVAEFTSNEIVAANDAAGNLFDCRPADLVGLNRQELHPPGERAAYEEAFRRGFENEQVERLEDGSPLYVTTLGGERKPVEINAQRIETDEQRLVLGVFRDISTRLNREQELEQTTRRLNTLLDATPLPVAVLDTDGRVQMWNQAATEVFGYEAGEVIGAPYPLFVDEEQLDDALGQVLDGTVLDGYEAVTRGKGGSRMHVEIYARPLYEDGEITGVIGSAVDVTDQKQRTQHLDVLHRLLRHNLRNKLSVIQGYSSVLLSDSPTSPDERQEAVERIAAAGDELTELSHHAMESRQFATATDVRPMAVTELLQTVRDVRSESPSVTINLPAHHDAAAVPSRASKALSWLLEHVAEYTGDPTLTVTVDVQDHYIELGIEGNSALLSEGDAELIRNDKETALKHGNGMDIARAYLTLTGLGGDLIQPSAGEHTLRVEIPRTDASDTISSPA